MIAIGQINQPEAAQAFCDYLASLGIEADWLPENRMYLIRVAKREAMPAAQRELQAFLQQPNAPRFRVRPGRAAQPEASASPGAGARSAGPAAASAQPGIAQRWLARAGPLTLALVCLSLLITIATGFASSSMLSYYLWFDLRSIAHGEWYRTVTPIFLHMSALHLLFNLMWLWDLAGIIERRIGGLRLALLVLLIALPSNLLQFLFTGPYFGGMSGVVYGLLGYLWWRGKRDPQFGARLNPSVLMLMLLWLVLCFTGWVGPVANVAHVSGLVIGSVCGVLSASVRRPGQFRES